MLNWTNLGLTAFGIMHMFISPGCSFIDFEYQLEFQDLRLSYIKGLKWNFKKG